MRRRQTITILFVFTALASGTDALAQAVQRARTENGREVILRGDGTWVFADPGPQPPQPPPAQSPAPQAARPQLQPLFPTPQGTGTAPQPGATNALPIHRPADATTAYTTRRGNFRFWYNPQKWRPTPENPDGRVQFQLAGQDAFIVLIPEGTPLPIPQLKTVAIENARQAGTDVRIVSEQPRSIGGREVLQMQFNVTIDRVPITFVGYYYGDPQGSVQLVGFTSQQDFQRFRAQIQEGLDGLDLNR